MASRKIARDLLLTRKHRHPFSLNFHRCQEISSGRSLRLNTNIEPFGSRQFGIFSEFSKQLKGEVKSNSEFQKTVKELNEKVGGITEELKTRTKQTKDKLYKQVDGIWTEAETTTKKVSANMKETLSAATEEVKESLHLGKQEPPQSSNSSTKSTEDTHGGNTTASGAEKTHKSNQDWQTETIYGKFKSTAASVSPKVSVAFQKMKEAKLVDSAKKGYSFVIDELNSTSSRKKQSQYASVPKEELSTKTDIVIVPSKQSRFSKKWDSFKEKMRRHPIFKRVNGVSEPVRTKGQELAEDIRERWETSDHPVVHKIQDLNETVFGETATALSFKEIRRRDPSFSLPDFVADVQDMIRPTITAYLKYDVDTLKKYCCPEVIERCKGEKRAYESQGYFYDNKLLHISEAEVRETKMLGSTPIIIVVFQTQQIYCVRDREGSVTAGSKDSIQTVHYAWAMQLIDAEELGEDMMYPTWRLREMQQIGFQALI
ncbi:putative Mitochondrial import inner membrane translocase subunit tim44,putative [Zostera marina]|uniref:Putative Mitochondrial import inner membrane translocase subunit tim44,putative n=1 Tax=Zostera marina TaxID=29655 RepID=A0A0K9PJ99_ZOSMR|nr:putative Mitochondrial import inner membrane translocase subunit tim44,putative [Zostera marina]